MHTMEFLKVEQQISVINKKIDKLMLMFRQVAGRGAEPAAASISLVEAMGMVGYRSKSGFYEFCREARLYPYRPGHYRPDDVCSAIARAALLKGKRGAVVMCSPALSEGSAP